MGGCGCRTHLLSGRSQPGQKKCAFLAGLRYPYYPRETCSRDCRLGFNFSGADSDTGVRVQEVNLGRAFGSSAVSAKGRKQGWAEGEIRPQGSPKGGRQLLLQECTLISHCLDMGCSRKGAWPQAGASPHLRPPPNKADG